MGPLPIKIEAASTPFDTVPTGSHRSHTKMAYSPGSKLSVAGIQNATVLSENKVMCTSGTFTGEIMLLVDWLIIAGGKEYQVNTEADADAVWTHAKQKAGIDPPSLTQVDQFEMVSNKLPQLLVPPPVPQLSHCECNFSDCDTEEESLEADRLLMSTPLPSPPAAPELAATPLAPSPSTKSKVPEPATASPSTKSKVPELRFPPPLASAAEPAPLPQRHVGDKLKWELNEETYRIAVFTDKGLLQVKSITDGGAQTHTHDCKCDACWEYNHSAPWRPRLPLAKAFFETESAWRASLPQGGNFYTKKIDSRYNEWL